MKVSKVAVLRGGPSEEYNISMKTGAGVLAALAPTDIATRDIIVTKDNQWLIDGFVKHPEHALYGVDVVFIALHGAYGEDGTIQRQLDALSIPYTGTKAYASALAMNKALTKEYVKMSGVLTPEYVRVTKSSTTDPHQIAINIGNVFGTKYFVKPVASGSSLGVSRANSVSDLGIILRDLMRDYDDLIVEELIEGKEATVGILENYRNQKFYDLPVIEIVPPAKSDFFSADVKYTGETEEICPGRFTKSEKIEMARLAQLVHKDLNLRHYSRSDFIVSEKGIYFLEVNTLPGLTDQSLFPKSVEAVGGNYTELIEHLINQAVTY